MPVGIKNIFNLNKISFPRISCDERYLEYSIKGLLTNWKIVIQISFLRKSSRASLAIIEWIEYGTYHDINLTMIVLAICYGFL